jgi:hypothetical protein
MSTNTTNIIAFKAISSFINDLSSVFGDEQRSLKLYAHLISKTTEEHELAIAKHTQTFFEFCVSNRTQIEEKDKNLKTDIIHYSDKVNINMSEIFNKADKSTTKIIWKHLLTISAIVDTTGQARKILKEIGDGESDFLSGIIEKLEEQVEPNTDPMTAISSIMSSGVFSELIGGMGSGLSDGSLNIEKLMGSVQKIVSKNDGPSGGDMSALTKGGSSIGDDQPDIAKMLGPIMNMMNGGGDGAPPDMAAMMGPIMNMMNGGGDGAPPDMAKMMSSLMSQGGDGAPK